MWLIGAKKGADFFTRKTVSSSTIQQSLECPICYETIVYNNISTVNAHVDSCLGDSDSALTPEECSRPTQISVPDYFGCNNISNSSGYVCPICGKNILGDNNTVNTHIDVCLNKNELRREIGCHKSVSSNSGIIAAEKRKLNLESFFEKKQKK